MKKLAIHPFTAKKIAAWKAGEGKRNQSIHPRVVNGYQQYPKVNTAKPNLVPDKGKYGKRKANLERRHHARDLSVADLNRSQTAAKLDWSKAFRVPGSMTH